MDTDPDFDFAITLICRRKRLGLSQDELADPLDITQNTISRWENGSRAPRDPAGVLMKLHELDDLLDDLLDQVIHLSTKDQAGRTVLTTYRADEHWWLADQHARDHTLPASLHQTATAIAAWELEHDNTSTTTIRQSR